MTMFSSKLGAAVQPAKLTPQQSLVKNLLAARAGQSAFLKPETAQSAISLEGFTESQSTDVSAAVTQLRSLITSAVGVNNAGKSDLIISQESAAIYGGLISSSPQAWQSAGRARYAVESLQPLAGVKDGLGGSQTHVFGHVGIDGATDQRVPAMEAYDVRNNRDVTGYSVAYNLQASRQNEFGEAFFPTVVIPPDQYGYNVQVRILYAYSEVQRATAATLQNWNRKNLVRAIIDATILAADQTKLIPVYRSGGGATVDNSANFVAGITPTTLTVDNQPLTTAPLKIGAQFDLLAICQTNAALAQGMEDQTDAVDSSARLSNLYFSLTGTYNSAPLTEYFAVDVSKLPSSDFYGSPIQNTRKLQLNFDTQDIVLKTGMLTVAGTASNLLGQLLTTNTARIVLSLSGSILQDKGNTTVTQSSIGVNVVNDVNGNPLSLTGGAGATIVSGLSSLACVGYDLTAFRTDSNRRSRGALIDVQHVNYLYTVPLLPPITALRPVTAPDAADGNMLSDLVASTHVQTSNRAVTALLDSVAFVKANWTSAAEIAANQPLVFGAASNLVLLSYAEQNLTVNTALDSIKDSERIADISALLYNTIRDMSLQLWINSGYGPASEYLYDGKPSKPVVIIGTDPDIGRYLQLLGDERLVGDQFDYKVVISYDSRMAGKLIVSFGQTDAFTSGQPCPLHCGNMAWRSEITLMMPMIRSGQQSMELTVQPSYRHVNNLPVFGVINITSGSISSAVNAKVAINMHSL